MKIDQLKLIIREEVRAAVKEELQDMLTEAVKIASQPEPQTTTPQSNYKEKPKQWSFGKNSTLDEMLQQTAKSMTSEEYKNVYAGTSDMVQKPNFASAMANQMGMVESSGPTPGIDISKLDFVSKAKSVFDASVKKDKQKAGLL